jgi:hypothetical protein
VSKKPQYRIHITVTTGPHKTPVQITEFAGRRNAFATAARLLLSTWRMIRSLERGDIHRIPSYDGMTREKWLEIHGEKAER